MAKRYPDCILEKLHAINMGNLDRISGTLYSAALVHAVNNCKFAVAIHCLNTIRGPDLARYQTTSNCNASSRIHLLGLARSRPGHQLQ